MIGILVSAATNLVTTWLDGKQKKQAAKDEREIKALTNEANWDEVQADGAKSSWKDEWLTILVSIPMVMAFIPGCEHYVKEGFRVLSEMPSWYQYLVGATFAAAYGMKTLKDKMWKM